MTTPDGGTSPRLSVSSPDVDLFGVTTKGRPNRRAWRIEITGHGQSPARPETVTMVTFSLIDGETGRRIGRTTVPFGWLRDVAFGSTMAVEIREGDFS